MGARREPQHFLIFSDTNVFLIFIYGLYACIDFIFINKKIRRYPPHYV